jgi:hypothetical protein
MGLFCHELHEFARIKRNKIRGKKEAGFWGGGPLCQNPAHHPIAENGAG